jgi:tellurite resistance protein TerC
LTLAFLDIVWLGTPVWMWLAFVAIVATLLALDLGVLHK